MRSRLVTDQENLAELKTAYEEYTSLKKISSENNKNISERSVIIDLSSPQLYKRYFYTLIKYFHLAGVSVYFPKFDFVYFLENVFKQNTHPSNYYYLIFQEGIMIYGDTPEPNENTLVLNEGNLSPDYFSWNFIAEKNIENAAHIPMTMHPLFYHNNFWDDKIDLNKTRKKSLFTAGNFDTERYSKFESTPFQMESRVQIYNELLKSSLYKEIKSTEELDIFTGGEEDNAILMIDTNSRIVRMHFLREILSKFNFYLAIPGIIMPYSHNIIEAISVGTIPIIHENYASIMTPPLIDMKDAIVYKNLAELVKKIEFAFQMDEKQLSEMRENVIDYYNSYLTPKAAVENIFKVKDNLLYLQSEYTGVTILENNLK